MKIEKISQPASQPDDKIENFGAKKIESKKQDHRHKIEYDTSFLEKDKTENKNNFWDLKNNFEETEEIEKTENLEQEKVEEKKESKIFEDKEKIIIDGKEYVDATIGQRIWATLRIQVFIISLSLLLGLILGEIYSNNNPLINRDDIFGSFGALARYVLYGLYYIWSFFFYYSQKNTADHHFYGLKMSASDGEKLGVAKLFIRAFLKNFYYRVLIGLFASIAFIFGGLIQNDTTLFAIGAVVLVIYLCFWNKLFPKGGLAYDKRSGTKVVKLKKE